MQVNCHQPRKQLKHKPENSRHGSRLVGRSKTIPSRAKNDQEPRRSRCWPRIRCCGDENDKTEGREWQGGDYREGGIGLCDVVCGPEANAVGSAATLTSASALTTEERGALRRRGPLSVRLFLGFWVTLGSSQTRRAGTEWPGRVALRFKRRQSDRAMLRGVGFPLQTWD